MKSYLNGSRVIIITDNSLDNFASSEGIYVDKLLGIVVYSTSFGMHQDCIDDFISRFGYDHISFQDLARIGNVVFEISNIDSKYLVVNYLPDFMSDKQINGYLEFVNKLEDNDIFLYRAEKANDKNFSFKYTEDTKDNVYLDIICEYLELQQKEESTIKK